MTSEIEKLQNRRGYTIMALSFSFPLWLLPQLDRLDGISIIHHIKDIGMLIFACMIILLLITRNRLLNLSADAQATLEDELVKVNRAKATRNGYFAFSAVALFLLLRPLGLTGHDVALLVLTAGVTTSSFSFAIFELDGA